MLFHDYIVAQRQPKPSPFADGLGRKERQEDLLPNLAWNAGAVVADANFDPVAEVFGRCRQGRFIALAIWLSAALDGGVEPVAIRLRKTRMISCG